MHPSLAESLSVAAGCALGALLRHHIGTFLAARTGQGFPWSTLLVNLSGCFLMGLLASLNRASADQTLTGAFLTTGLLGGYTTVSTFAMQTWELLEAGQFTTAALNMLTSLLLCLGALTLGHSLTAFLT